MRFLVPLLLVCVVLVAAGPARYTGTLYLTKRDGTPTFTAGVIDKDKGTAWATFDDGEYALSDGGNGWGVLYLNLNPKHLADNDNTAMYAAGYLEGAMTWQQIWDNYKNYYFGWFSDKSVPKKAKEFFDKNLKYARDQISKKKEDSYWSEVDLLMNQFDGLLDGYNSVADSDKKLTAMDFLMINGNGDMDDILDALGVSVTEATRKRIHRNRETLPGGDPLPGFFNDHCSASIRVLPGNADLFFSHDTWSSYDQMTRIFKHYDFPLTRAATEVDATRRISFSSSPGFIASTDDWYLTNKGLAVFETTTEFYNQSMYNQIGPENCLLSFWRSMLANYNAKTGPEWIHWFEQQNSGTYNNQWMIVNLNLFTPGMAALPDDLLWITEQLPGFCTSGDMTDFLRKDGYWASYNIPYFPYVYDISGFKAMYDKHGDEYSWSKCARAKIFARDAPKVTDYAGFQKMMNSNDYKNDPLSDGYPDRAIMARGDLAKSFPVPSGGIDSKASSYSRALKLECDAINGPTHQSLPVFDWNAFNSVPHLGQPQQFNFDWVAMTPTGAQSTVHARFPHAMPALASSAVPRTQPSVAASVAETVLPVVENVLAVM